MAGRGSSPAAGTARSSSGRSRRNVAPASSTPTGSAFTQRVFIDSGLWIANASTDEIEAGLREDAKRIREWLETLQTDSSRNGTQP